MRAAVLPFLVGVLVVSACSSEEGGASHPKAVSTSERPAEPVKIRDRMTVAATPGAEPIATGQVLHVSTLGGSPFCLGGTIRDSHASLDPSMEPFGLIDRTITCPNGTVRVGIAPGQVQGLIQGGSWTIVSGTGAFEGLRGTGELKVRYDPKDEALAHDTLTGTVKR
jgi:hypothetical protein